jgi:hypothetical protein
MHDPFLSYGRYQERNHVSTHLGAEMLDPHKHHYPGNIIVVLRPHRLGYRIFEFVFCDTGASILFFTPVRRQISKIAGAFSRLPGMGRLVAGIDDDGAEGQYYLEVST